MSKPSSEPRHISAKFDSYCPVCSGAVARGERIIYDPAERKARHPACADIHYGHDAVIGWVHANPNPAPPNDNWQPRQDQGSHYCPKRRRPKATPTPKAPKAPRAAHVLPLSDAQRDQLLDSLRKQLGWIEDGLERFKDDPDLAKEFAAVQALIQIAELV